MTHPPDSPTSTDNLVLVEPGPITKLTLNRPEQANALSWSMGEALSDAVERINADDTARAVIVCGAGQHFSAGGDFAFIEQMSQLDASEIEATMRRFYAMYLRVLDLRVPTIAVVHGAAIGAGLCLALACDLRIGSTTAKLGVNFVRIGLHPGMGATALVPHLCGPGPAADLLLTAESVDGLRAERLGLLSAAVDEADVERVAQLRAEAIARNSAQAVTETTETLRAPLKARLERALPREAQCQTDDFGGPDVRRAIEAFRHKTRR